MKVQSKFFLLSASLFLAIVSSAVAGGGDQTTQHVNHGGQGYTVVSQTEIQSDDRVITEYVLRDDAGNLVREYRDNQGRITTLSRREGRHLKRADKLNARAQKQLDMASGFEKDINSLKSRNSNIAESLGGRQVVRHVTTTSNSSATTSRDSATSRSSDMETSVSVSTSVNHENDQFAKPAGGCPNGMIDVGDGMCYGANLFTDGPCPKAAGGQGTIAKADETPVTPAVEEKKPEVEKKKEEKPAEKVVAKKEVKKEATQPKQEKAKVLPTTKVPAKNPNPGRTKPKADAKKPLEQKRPTENCTIKDPCADELAKKDQEIADLKKQQLAQKEAADKAAAEKAAQVKVEETTTDVGENQNIVSDDLVDLSAKLKKASNEKGYATSYSKGGKPVGMHKENASSKLKIKIRGKNISANTAKNLTEVLSQADESFDSRVKARKAYYEAKSSAGN